ncbi:hypothetical protein B0A49_13710 [Cryomyces minteri]|uniref:CCHC-type domain-containing protein n=1 Tax=Cryomyces minteri TaxID=331657 RepID=A0A4U0VDB9_9PEZI|nr:hypothetical protein B0A49_13710 [Cryomyces minteri]
MVVLSGPIRSISALPSPGQGGAPLFTGSNVTQFIELWEELCMDHAVVDPDRVRKVAAYCSPNLSGYVKTLTAYIARDWEGLKKKLLKEYKDADSDRILNSRGFLQALKSVKRTTKDSPHGYCRQYKTIAARLSSRQLDDMTRGLWFLHGLPDVISIKVINKMKLQIDNPESFQDFEGIYEQAVFYLDSQAAVQDCLQPDNTISRYEPLVKLSMEPIPKEPYPALQSTFSTTTLDPGLLKMQELSTKATEELTKMFGNLSVNVLKLAQQGGSPGRIQGTAPSWKPPMAPGQAPSQGAYRSQTGQAANTSGTDPGTQYVGVAYATATGAASTLCNFCKEDGHWMRECPRVDELCQGGQMHFTLLGRKAMGPNGSQGDEFRLSNVSELSHYQQVCQQLDRYYEKKQAAIQNQGKPIAQGTTTQTVMANFVQIEEDTDEEDDVQTDGPEFFVEVRAARSSKDLSYEGWTPAPNQKDYRVMKPGMKQRAQLEASLPAAKSVRSGQYVRPVVGEEDELSTQGTLPAEPQISSSVPLPMEVDADVEEIRPAVPPTLSKVQTRRGEPRTRRLDRQIALDANPEEVFKNAILNTNVTLPLSDFMGVAPAVSKLFYNRIPNPHYKAKDKVAGATEVIPEARVNNAQVVRMVEETSMVHSNGKDYELIQGNRTE